MECILATKERKRKYKCIKAVFKKDMQILYSACKNILTFNF